MGSNTLDASSDSTSLSGRTKIPNASATVGAILNATAKIIPFTANHITKLLFTMPGLGPDGYKVILEHADKLGTTRGDLEVFIKNLLIATHSVLFPQEMTQKLSPIDFQTAANNAAISLGELRKTYKDIPFSGAEANTLHASVWEWIQDHKSTINKETSLWLSYGDILRILRLTELKSMRDLDFWEDTFNTFTQELDGEKKDEFGKLVRILIQCIRAIDTELDISHYKILINHGLGGKVLPDDEILVILETLYNKNPPQTQDDAKIFWKSIIDCTNEVASSKTAQTLNGENLVALRRTLDYFNNNSMLSQFSLPNIL